MQPAREKSAKPTPGPTLVESGDLGGVPPTEGAAVGKESSYHYYGWRVVLAACLGVMAGFGSLFVYTFSVFVKPLAADFGWTREAISGGFAIAAVTLGTASPLLGRLIDRFGPRYVILGCMSVYGCAIASLSLLHGVAQFYMTCFVLGVVGNGGRIWRIRDRFLHGFAGDWDWRWRW